MLVWNVPHQDMCTLLQLHDASAIPSTVHIVCLDFRPFACGLCSCEGGGITGLNSPAGHVHHVVLSHQVPWEDVCGGG